MRSVSERTDEAEELRTEVLDEPFQVNRITSTRLAPDRNRYHQLASYSLKSSASFLPLGSPRYGLLAKVAAQEPNIYALIDDLQEEG